MGPETSAQSAARGGITIEELQLAARNHGMPLEALRYDLTPVGLHYLLIHFDIPDADEAEWEVEVGGLVRSPMRLSMAGLRARPAVTHTVTLECAGNGRARLQPRPISQPWLLEAVGTAAGPAPRSRSCSPGRITACRTVTSTTTNGAFRPRRRCVTTCSWRTRCLANNMVQRVAVTVRGT